MEDVLSVYTRPYNPKRPQVCLDETSRQLLADVTPPQPMTPGHPAKEDYEYERRGVVNLFMVCEPLRGWRDVMVSDRRTRIDWAHCIKDLVDVHYPDAEKIVLVQDNLNTHTPASLYEAFPPTEAKRLADKLELHYTPKHGSWLNMAERRPHWCRSSTEWRQPDGVYHGAAPRPPARGPCRVGGPAVRSASRAPVGDRTARWQPSVRLRHLVYAACRVAGGAQRARERAG
jgi:hypothetical protein